MKEVWQKLHDFCAAREGRGFDPYDGLNSPLARVLPGKFLKQAWTQFHRRSPVNLRPLVGIKPTLNAKGLALLAMGNGEPKLLESLHSLDGGWGYPFDWQSRAFFTPHDASYLIPHRVCGTSNET